MINPVFLGLIGARLVFGLVGVVRAAIDFGNAGIIAFLEVLLAPVAVAVVMIYVTPRFSGGRVDGLLPSDSTWRRMVYGVVIVAAIGASLTGLFGVGWLVRR